MGRTAGFWVWPETLEIGLGLGFSLPLDLLALLKEGFSETGVRVLDAGNEDVIFPPALSRSLSRRAELADIFLWVFDLRGYRTIMILFDGIDDIRVLGSEEQEQDWVFSY